MATNGARIESEVVSDPMLERRTRRRFSGAEKQRLLRDFDALSHGMKGAWLRRQALYAAQLSTWRKEERTHGVQGLEPVPSGRKPRDARDREIETLTLENRRLQKRLRVAEGLVSLQKKVMALVEAAGNDEVMS